MNETENTPLIEPPSEPAATAAPNRYPFFIRFTAGYILIIVLCLCLILSILPLMRLSALIIPTRFMPVTGGGEAEINGDTYFGTLERREVHEWTFEGSTGDYIILDFTDFSNTNPRVHVFDPDGELIIQEYPLQNYNHYTYTYLNKRGTYTIQIDMLQGDKYRFRIRRD